MVAKHKTQRKQSAYERRIERYLAAHPGATRQEARGHKAREHVERKVRETAAGKLTTYQRQAVRNFAYRQARRDPRNDDPEATATAMRAWTEREGWDRFRELRDKVNALAKGKRARVRRTVREGRQVLRVDLTGRSRNAGEMEELSDAWEIPFEWMFYH